MFIELFEVLEVGSDFLLIGVVLLDGRDAVVEGAKAFVVESEGHLVDHKLVNWLLNGHLDWDGVSERVSTSSKEVELEVVGLEEEIWVEFGHHGEWDLELEDGSWSDLEVDWDLDEVEWQEREVHLFREADIFSLLPGPVSVVLHLNIDEDGLAWVGSVRLFVSFDEDSLVHLPLFFGVVESTMATSLTLASSAATSPLAHEHLSHILKLLAVLLKDLLLLLNLFSVLLVSILLSLLLHDIVHVLIEHLLVSLELLFALESLRSVSAALSTTSATVFEAMASTSAASLSESLSALLSLAVRRIETEESGEIFSVLILGVVLVKNSNQLFGSLLGCLDLDEGVLVTKSLFAHGAVVKVLADDALVPVTDDWVHVASIADEALMHKEVFVRLMALVVSHLDVSVDLLAVLLLLLVQLEVVHRFVEISALDELVEDLLALGLELLLDDVLHHLPWNVAWVLELVLLVLLAEVLTEESS